MASLIDIFGRNVCNSSLFFGPEIGCSHQILLAPLQQSASEHWWLSGGCRVINQNCSELYYSHLYEQCHTWTFNGKFACWFKFRFHLCVL